MITPSNVREAALKVEEENHRFRRFLKTHADEEELDQQFLSLHKELFASYDCSKCRNCCRSYEHGNQQIICRRKKRSTQFIDEH